jgi:hypothetical protein
MGVDSPFHETYGYYADAVDTATATLVFTQELARRGVVSKDRLLALLAQTDITAQARARISARIAGDFASRVPD